jgi:hypothetical protein
MTSALIRATTALKPLSVLIPRQQKARTFRRGDMAPRKHPSKSLPSGARFRRALHHRVGGVGGFTSCPVYPKT